MTDLAPFPDPKAAVAARLADLVAVTYAGARTLTTIQAGKLPAARVNRAGGGDDRITETAVVTVSIFARDADTAEGVAEACRQRLTSQRGAGTAAALIDVAVTLAGPQLVTSPDVAAVQCATATYRISMRRPAQ